VHEKKEADLHRQFEEDISRNLFSGPRDLIFSNPSTVAIFHRYGKSSIHTLLIPAVASQSPPGLAALQDPQKLALVREEAGRLHRVVADELQRLYGSFSTQEAPRQAILNREIEIDREEDMPQGHD